MVIGLNFEEIVKRNQEGLGVGMPNMVRIRIPNARDLLKSGLDYYVDKFSRGGAREAKWLDRNYDPIVELMEDNRCAGLLMIGSCGLGKSLIGRYVLPIVIREKCNKILNVYNAQDLNKIPDEILSRHLVYIDDLGTECVSNIYGNKRIPFIELCDAVEQKGKLLICSTNLTIDELSAKYGERTIDRLRATTKVVPFVGESLRGKHG